MTGWGRPWPSLSGSLYIGILDRVGRRATPNVQGTVCEDARQPTLRRPVEEGAGAPFVRFPLPRKNEGAERRQALVRNAAPVARLAAGPISGAPEMTAGYAGRCASRRSAAALANALGIRPAPGRA